MDIQDFKQYIRFVLGFVADIEQELQNHFPDNALEKLKSAKAALKEDLKNYPNITGEQLKS